MKVFPEVKTCCFFISLRTGSKIFGFLSLLCSFLLIVVFAALLLFLHVTFRNTVMKSVISLGIVIFPCAIQAATSTFLLLGVYQDKTNMIPPWLVSTTILAVGEVIYLLETFIHSYNTRRSFRPKFDEFIFFFIALVIEASGILVVYSYYRLLKETRPNNSII